MAYPTHLLPTTVVGSYPQHLGELWAVINYRLQRPPNLRCNLRESPGGDAMDDSLPRYRSDDQTILPGFEEAPAQTTAPDTVSVPDRLRAALGPGGMPLAWHHTIVGQSIIAGTLFESLMIKDGLDPSSVEGAAELPYRVPALRVDLHTTKAPVRVQWWRSVGHCLLYTSDAPTN